MSPLVRQTYTNISLAAMIPAAIWAAAAYSAQNLSQIVGGFPFYYLAVCQLLIAPRYVAGAIVVERLGQSKRFSIMAGMIGLGVAGLIVDVTLTVMFAHAISVPGHNWPFGIPVIGLPVGLVIMLLAAAISGYAAQWNKPLAPPPKTGKRR